MYSIEKCTQNQQNNDQVTEVNKTRIKHTFSSNAPTSSLPMILVNIPLSFLTRGYVTGLSTLPRGSEAIKHPRRFEVINTKVNMVTKCRYDPEHK